VSEKSSEPLPNVAVISAGVLALTAVVLTVKAALDRPVVMMTDAGTVAAGAPLARLTVLLLEAMPFRVTVQVDDAGGVTLAGTQFKLESPAATG
jgi:hypothetical protein